MGPRQELGSLELLSERERLLLGPALRGVVGREAEKDDEGEEHREGRREHAEHARRAV